MAEVKRKIFPSSELAEDSLRWTVVVLFSATLVFACVAATFLEFKSRSAHMAMANLPLAVLLPFVAWLLANAFLKRFVPRLSMTSAELRLALSMLWVGGSFAGYNWITQWVGAMAAPRYYASPENRWQELIFDYLPWWMFPSNFPGGDRGIFSGAGGRCSSAVGSVDSSDFLGDVRRVGDDGYWAGFDGGVPEAVGSARTADVSTGAGSARFDGGVRRQARLAAVYAELAVLGGVCRGCASFVVESDRILDAGFSQAGDF